MLPERGTKVNGKSEVSINGKSEVSNILTVHHLMYNKTLFMAGSDS
jgi:hypothetical protein